MVKICLCHALTECKRYRSTALSFLFLTLHRGEWLFQALAALTPPPPQKKILNLLNRKLGGPRNRSGRFREDVNKSYKNDQQDATV